MSTGPACKLAKVSLLEPIVVILGATGVGKSKLALEVARKFSGEIINADAMQTYQGLDIVTNKVSKDEQKQCPHHLFDFINPLTFNYNVADYKASALKILDGIHSRGNLPIIVGGTNYYVESLLWDFVLPVCEEKNSPSEGSEAVDSTSSSEELYDKLMHVDPDRAKKIHPRDTRKLKRALEVFTQTGRTLTSLLKEQHGNDHDPQKVSGPLRYPNSCMIWVRSDQAVLNERINKRVDSMVDSGLLKELSDFHEAYNAERLSGDRVTDYEHGIFQSIGFKEFHDYLMMDGVKRESPEGTKFFQECISNMKMVTRRYSRKQIKWIRNRFLRRRGDVCLPPVYAVDSSAIDLWDAGVRAPSFEIVESFLTGFDRRHHPLPVVEKNNPSEFNRCLECDKTFVKLDDWKIHVASRRHKKMLERAKRLMTFTPELNAGS